MVKNEENPSRKNEENLENCVVNGEKMKFFEGISENEENPEMDLVNGEKKRSFEGIRVKNGEKKRNFEGNRKNEENPESDLVNGEKKRNFEGISENEENPESDLVNGEKKRNFKGIRKNNGSSSVDNNVVVKRERPSRACTKRAVQRMQEAAAAEAKMAAAEKKRKGAKRKERLARRVRYLEEELEEVWVGEEEEEVGEEDEDDIDDGGQPSSSRGQCSKVITPLVGEPEPSQLPRWNIRSMWQLASILNFLNVFRHLLNIKAEFSADEFETALICFAIPPIARMALGHNTWVTVLCRKLRHWWHWQEDIRSYIEDSIKQGFRLSSFRKERLGGDSHGISYENDPIIGHRLYREIRKFEVKRGKGRNIPPIPNSSYQWETVATNLDEFLDVSEKLFTSTNRIEVSVGKKLKNDKLAEIEKVHKRKEKLLKKQHRQALLLDNMLHMDALAAGRSLRDRKPVTYTFDDFDKSINDAIKETKKKPPSPDPTGRRDFMRHEVATNGTWSGPSQYSHQLSSGRQFTKESTDDEYDENIKDETIDLNNHQRQRPQRFSVKDFGEAVSDNDADYDSDDDIVGEAVYDEEYLRQKKRTRSSSSEEEEEYHWDDENPEEEEEEEANDYSPSDDSDQPRKFMKLRGRTRRGSKMHSVDKIQSGLRRSNRATRNRMDYSYYDLSESENELMKPEKSNGSHGQADASDNPDPSESEDSYQNTDNQDIRDDQTMEEHSDLPEEEQEQEHDEDHEQGEGQGQEDQDHPPAKPRSPDLNKVEVVKKRQFLDLNELAPGSGYDDCPNSMKDEGTDDF
ncbi:hypothetical protein Leryth_017656 [Lithospermum erythrorhizon]|nr:hypothetical protein Leryth_017656 [Lithospermum erythrorhizon]